MSLPGLIERGIEVVLREPGADAELRQLAIDAGYDLDAVDHLRQTLVAMPALLVAVTRDLDHADAATRRVFHAVIDYLIQEENLIPSHDGRPLLGLFDDVYLVHLAAKALEAHLQQVDMRSVSGGAHLLEQVLPRSVTSELRGIVDRAVTGARPSGR